MHHAAIIIRRTKESLCTEKYRNLAGVYIPFTSTFTHLPFG